VADSPSTSRVEKAPYDAASGLVVDSDAFSVLQKLLGCDRLDDISGLRDQFSQDAAEKVDMPDPLSQVPLDAEDILRIRRAAKGATSFAEWLVAVLSAAGGAMGPGRLGELAPLKFKPKGILLCR
jgi:hypothetical protein